MEMHPGMHEPLLRQLRITFPQLQSPRVYTTVLWMMAEYSASSEDVEGALDAISTALGPPPFGADLKGQSTLQVALFHKPLTHVQPGLCHRIPVLSLQLRGS